MKLKLRALSEEDEVILAQTDPVGCFWLRLTLTAPGATSLSFHAASPVGDAGEASAPRGQSENRPLILLSAPDAVAPDSAWNLARFPRERVFEVVPPRITLAEFDRWIENPALLNRLVAAGAHGATLGVKEKLAEKLKSLRETLMMVEACLAVVEGDRSYREAGLDPEALTAALNTLPDPAVTKIEIVLSAASTVRRSPDKAVAFAPASPDKPSPASLARILHDTPAIVTDIDELNGLLIAKTPVKKTEQGYMKYIADKTTALLRRISDAMRIRVVVHDAGKAPDHIADVEFAVPAGLCAQLEIRPLVPADLFFADEGAPAVFAEGFGELAAGHGLANNLLVFSPRTILIEAMAIENPSSAQVFEALKIRPYGRRRKFDVVFQPGHDSSNRPFMGISTIRLEEQRWRYLGRPLTRSFDPGDKDLRDDGAYAVGVDSKATDTPFRAVRDPNDAKGPIRRFEAEAFAGRAAADSRVTTARLKLFEASTTLPHEDWQAPDATFFRLRAAALNRYSGALTEAARVLIGQVLSWPDETGAKTEAAYETDRQRWRRVAALADAGIGVPPRPQIGPVLPVTRRFEEGDSGPPIMATIFGQPLEHGGLAARVVADIGMVSEWAAKEPGQGAPSPPRPDDGVYTVDSLRKEAGPNPIEGLVPIAGSDSLRLVAPVLGPVGMTKDPIAASAPAFIAAAHLVRPRSLDPEAAVIGEDTFYKLSFARLLDDAWVHRGAAALAGDDGKAKEPDPSRTGQSAFWVGLPSDGTTDATLSWSAPGVDRQALLKFDSNGPDSVVLSVARAALDPYAVLRDDLEEDKFIELAEAGPMGLRLLVRRLGPGNYSLTAMSFVERAQPLVLASVTWSTAILANPDPPADLLEKPVPQEPDGFYWDGKEAATTPAHFSGFTETSWSRTLPDFHRVDMVTGADTRRSLDVGELKFVSSSTAGYGFRRLDQPVSLRPRRSGATDIAFAHRHLMACMLGKAPELQRPPHRGLPLTLASAGRWNEGDRPGARQQCGRAYRGDPDRDAVAGAATREFWRRHDRAEGRGLPRQGQLRLGGGAGDLGESG